MLLKWGSLQNSNWNSESKSAQVSRDSALWFSVCFLSVFFFFLLHEVVFDIATQFLTVFLNVSLLRRLYSVMSVLPAGSGILQNWWKSCLWLHLLKCFNYYCKYSFFHSVSQCFPLFLFSLILPPLIFCFFSPVCSLYSSCHLSPSRTFLLSYLLSFPSMFTQRN